MGIDKKSPIVCVERDKKTVEFCINSVSFLEPCSVLEVNGFGVKIIYYALSDKLKKISKGRVFKEINAQTKDELKEFVYELNEETKPITCLVNISVNDDCSWFIQELDDLRDRRSTEFVSVVTARVGEVLEAVMGKQKILYRSMFALEPIDFDDLKLLLKDFERRFSFVPSNEQMEKIYEFSGGHIGLIKSLYLLLKTNPDTKLGEEKLVNLPSIASRLEEVVKLLPDDLLKDLFYYPNSSKYKDFFERYYFVKNGKIFSPLLYKYLEKIILNSSKDNKSINEFKLNLSKSELDTFNILFNNIGKIVSRDELANIQWKDDAEDKYSDWAIDQIIYRLRSKLKIHKANYKIITKKGRGFILQNK